MAKGQADTIDSECADGGVQEKDREETRATKEAWREEESIVTKVAMSGESVEWQREDRTWRAEWSNGQGGQELAEGSQQAIVFRVNSVYNGGTSERVAFRMNEERRTSVTVDCRIEDKTWRVEDGTIGYRTEKTWLKGPNRPLYSE